MDIARFAIFFLSTLAVHMKKVSTDGYMIPPGCEGKTFCEIKPADYPQEEIDNYFINNPDFHKRLKRSYYAENLRQVSLEAPDYKGNCRTSVEIMAPFQVLNASKLPEVIVQSKYYEQKIEHVTCDGLVFDVSANGNECFADFVPSIKRTKCVQKIMTHRIVLYDRDAKRMNIMNAEIPVDCICGAYDVD